MKIILKRKSSKSPILACYQNFFQHTDQNIDNLAEKLHINVKIGASRKRYLILQTIIKSFAGMKKILKRKSSKSSTVSCYYEFFQRTDQNIDNLVEKLYINDNNFNSQL